MNNKQLVNSVFFAVVVFSLGSLMSLLISNYLGAIAAVLYFVPFVVLFVVLFSLTVTGAIKSMQSGGIIFALAYVMLPLWPLFFGYFGIWIARSKAHDRKLGMTEAQLSYQDKM